MIFKATEGFDWDMAFSEKRADERAFILTKIIHF